MGTDAHSAEEIAAAPTNRQVGTTLLLSNERVNVWEIALAPGERVPLHCHATDYFWVCVEAGRALVRGLDGSGEPFDVGLSEMEYSHITPERPMIHDLENRGSTPLRFVTVELKT
jgi:hypothetical protein